MSWNYRIFHTCYQPPEAEALVHYFSFREVYYAEDDERVNAISAEAAHASGESSLELMQDHACMQEAWRRPVLTPADVPGYVYGRYECTPPTEVASEKEVHHPTS
jgi:hypothetical protein